MLSTRTGYFVDMPVLLYKKEKKNATFMEKSVSSSKITSPNNQFRDGLLRSFALTWIDNLSKLSFIDT